MYPKSFIICLSKVMAGIQLGFSYSLSILRYLQNVSKEKQRHKEKARLETFGHIFTFQGNSEYLVNGGN